MSQLGAGPASRAEFVVVSGLSGAGRSETAKVLEDLGYFVIDNLPPSLIAPVADLAVTGRARSRVALIVDARGGAFSGDVSELRAALAALRERGVQLRVIFLEAADEVLMQRYDVTRRRHPLGEGGVPEAIALERKLLLDFREDADLVIDTSDLNVHELRERIVSILPAGEHDLLVTLTSFGFKYGLPRDADVVLDVRFLPNPHWVEYLRPKTGLHPDVRAYVLGQPDTQAFLDRVRDLFEVSLPGFRREAKQYLTVAIGCTGGKHRSVVIANELALWFEAAGLTVNVAHRDVDRE